MKNKSKKEFFGVMLSSPEWLIEEKNFGLVYLPLDTKEKVFAPAFL